MFRLFFVFFLGYCLTCMNRKAYSIMNNFRKCKEFWMFKFCILSHFIEKNLIEDCCVQ